MKALIIIVIISSNFAFSQTWAIHTEYNSFLAENRIEDIVVAYNNEVWLINQFKAVFRLKDNNWIRYDKENTGFKSFSFGCIELLEDNSLMFGHSDDLDNPEFLIFKDESWTQFKSPDAFFNYVCIRDILYINENNIWFVTCFGVFHKDYNNWIHYLDNQNQGHDLESIHSVNGNIFVFGSYGAAYKYIYNGSPVNKFTFVNKHQDFPKNVGDGPYFSSKNKDFIYTNSKNGISLMKFDGKQWFEESFNLQDTVKSIYLTRDDKVLAITYNAVYEYENSNCQKLFDIPDSIITVSPKLKLREIDYNNNYYFSNNSNFFLITYTPQSNSVEPSTEIAPIFPNPTNDIINLNISEPTHIELYDILGNKLFEKFSTRLDLSDLSPGVYYIKYSGQTKMVVKE